MLDYFSRTFSRSTFSMEQRRIQKQISYRAVSLENRLLRRHFLSLSGSVPHLFISLPPRQRRIFTCQSFRLPSVRTLRSPFSFFQTQKRIPPIPICTIYGAKIQFEPGQTAGYTGFIKEVRYDYGFRLHRESSHTA